MSFDIETAGDVAGPVTGGVKVFGTMMPKVLTESEIGKLERAFGRRECSDCAHYGNALQHSPCVNCHDADRRRMHWRPDEELYQLATIRLLGIRLAEQRELLRAHREFKQGLIEAYRELRLASGS